MKAIKYEKDAVLIQDGNIKAWIDIRIENEDLVCDWNKNDFCITDPNDVALKKWQENLDNFENATCLAIKTLEDVTIIYQDNKTKWHTTKDKTQ